MLDHTVSRRSFISGSVALGAGFAVGFDLATNAAIAGAANERFSPNPWLSIGSDNTITFVLDKTEMGQGVHTSLSMILAEELDVELIQLTVVAAPADRVFATHSDLGAQMTGGSSSIKSSFEPLKIIGGTARQMIVNAAAKSWNVDPKECRTASGAVYHDASKRSGNYGQFALAAAQEKVPVPIFKDPKEYRYIGKSTKRLDASDKVTGATKYGIDTVVPHMLVAAVMRCPVIGGSLKSVDDTGARALPGVRHIVKLSYGVAVVADSFWQARKGVEALVVTWDEGALAQLSSASIREEFLALAKTDGKKVRKDGDVEKATSAAVKTIEAIYETPFLAHATMEPQNCVAYVTKESCEVWAPTQTPGLCVEAARSITGLSPDSITIHQTAIGGGFGRRLVTDFIAEAIMIAMELSVPVKVIWTREDDMRHDYYRPASYNAMSGGIDADGKPVFWRHRVVAPSILAYFLPEGLPAMAPQWLPTGFSHLLGRTAGKAFNSLVPDDTSTEGAKDVAYAIPNVLVDFHQSNPGVPVGFWRAVGHSHHGFMVESFIDELAHLAAQDPYQFRRNLLSEHPRQIAVLDRVASEIGWNTPPPAGVFRGIAQHASFASYAAEAVEVQVDAKGNIKITRIVAAIDCGTVVNPDGVNAQLESAIIFGLSAALKGAITIDHGRVVQSNFHEYEVMRMQDIPKIETHVIASNQPPTGVGEPGLPPLAPALANALFAATGKRQRTLPLQLTV